MVDVERYQDFFVAGAGVAGALIGLLFVAIPVTGDRLREVAGGPLHRARAAAALTAFTNALVVSLFGLIPGIGLGPAVVTVAAVGVVTVTATLISLLRQHAVRIRSLRDEVFVVGLAVVFVVELVSGVRMEADRSGSALGAVCIVVVVCFLIGIARAWELIGGPVIGLTAELARLGHPPDRPPGTEPGASSR